MQGFCVLLERRVLLLAAVIIIASGFEGVISHEDHPLAKIAVHKTVFSLDEKAYIKASTSVLGVNGQDSEWASLELGTPSPSNDDRVRVFSPANFSAATCDPENPEVLPPMSCTSSIKYQYVNYSSSKHESTGKGSLKLQSINQRSDFSFTLFLGGMLNVSMYC